MKAVIRQLAQAGRHYSTLPLFELLSDEVRDARLATSPVPALGACGEAYERFDRDRAADLERAMRRFIVDVAMPYPLLAARLSQIAQPAPPARTWVIAESIAETGRVLRATAPGRIDAGAFAELVLDGAERSACLDAAFRVFDLFADWSNGVHSQARDALARVAPPAVASAAALHAAG